MAESGHAGVVRDPICGMTVDPAAGKPSHAHAGRLFHFCNPGCRDKFVNAPEDYLTAADPVCGMSVDRASARHVASHEGRRFYFFSAASQATFAAAPAHSLYEHPAPTSPAAATQTNTNP